MKRLNYSLLLIFILSFSLISLGSMATVNANGLTQTDGIQSDADHGDQIPVDPGSPVSVNPNSSVELVTPSGVMLNLTVNESLEITFDEFDANPNASLPDHLESVGTFVHVSVNDTGANFNATINLPFDDSDLPRGVNEAELHLSFFNGTSDTWEGVPSVANVSSDMVSADTGHFSTWAITGDTTPDQAKNGDHVNVTLGRPVQVDPNASVVLETPSGVMVNLTINESLQITFDEFDANPNATLPEGITNVSPFVHVGTNDTEANYNATLSLPYNADSLPDTADETAFQMRYFNASTSAWENVTTVVDVANATVNANSSHFSSWVATADQANISLPMPEPGVPFDIEPGQPVVLTPGERLSLVTPSGISVELSVNESVEIKMYENATNPVGDIPSDKIGLDLYLTVELNQTTDLNATLEIPLPDQLPENLNVSTLEAAYFDPSSDSWETVPAWSENGKAYANVTHFSTWTLFGDANEDTIQDTTPESSDEADGAFLFFPGMTVMVFALAAIPLVKSKFKRMN